MGCERRLRGVEIAARRGREQECGSERVGREGIHACSDSTEGARRGSSAYTAAQVPTRILRTLAVALVWAPALAYAQDPMDCHTDPRAPLEVSPASGAPNASLDAPILVRYGAGYFGPDGPGDPPSTLFQLVQCGVCGSPCDVGSGTAVPGLVQTQGDDLIFLPDGGLTGFTQYAGHASGVDAELDFTFCSGGGRDTQPPTGAALSEPSSVQVGSMSCLADGGYRIQVYFPPASDDGPPGSIEYLLFQTRGSGIDAPTLVNRVRNFQTDRITMAYLLPNAEAGTPICLQVVTVDGAGHATVPEGDRCFDPVGRVTFQGCSVTPGAGHGLTVLGLGWIVAMIARRRRR